MKPQNGVLPKGNFSPLRVLIVLLGGIFLSEIAAMVIVYLIEPMPYLYLTLIDASIMLVFMFPVVYFFSLRPLLRYMASADLFQYC